MLILLLYKYDTSMVLSIRVFTHNLMENHALADCMRQENKIWTERWEKYFNKCLDGYSDTCICEWYFDINTVAILIDVL